MPPIEWPTTAARGSASAYVSRTRRSDARPCPVGGGVSEVGPELRSEVVPRVAAGEAGAAWCMTEPTVGSDLSGIKTTAIPDGDDWVLSGQKRFISNAPWADWYAVLARRGEKDFGVFMVHRDDPGVSFGPHEKKMGMRGSPPRTSSWTAAASRAAVW
jgi:alkylation response protein AidB-like acyl-CoA dehydrogenase